MSAPVALVLATIAFFAVAILGLGILSYFSGREIVETPGLGHAPGVWGMLAALVTFSGTLWTTLHPERPAYGPIVLTALATPLAHVFAFWGAVFVSGAGFVVATTVAGDLVRGGPSAVLMLVAGVVAWGGVALRRTRARSPRWRWERESEDDDI